MATTKRDLQLQQQARATRFEPDIKIYRGFLIAVGANGVRVNEDDDSLLWVQSLETGNTNVFQAYNPGVIQDIRANMAVLYRRDPKQPARWALTRFDKQLYYGDPSVYDSLPDSSVQPHAANHEFPPGYPGPDYINIHARAIVDFAVRPTAPASMKVRVYSGWYPGVTNYSRFIGPVNSQDFTASIPGTAGQALIVAISIDSSGTLNYTNGTAYVDGLPIPAAAWPAVTTDQMIISAVRLVNGMTEITEANFDVEIRPLLAPGGLAGGIDRAKVSRVYQPDGTNIVLEAEDNFALDVTFHGGIDFDVDGSSHAISNLQDTQLSVTSFGSLVLSADEISFIATDTASTGFVFNNGQLAVPFRVAGTATNLFVTDPGNNRVGIGTATPATTLDVNGDLTITEYTIHSGDTDTFTRFQDDQWGLTVGGLAMINAQNTTQNVLEIGDVAGTGDVDVNLNSGALFVQGSDGDIGLGTTTPATYFHIYRPSGAAGQELFRLESSNETGFFSMADGASTGFLPIFVMRGQGVNGFGSDIIGYIPVGNDSLATGGAAVVIEGRQGTGFPGGTTLASANIFQVQNFGQQKLTINAAGDVGIRGAGAAFTPTHTLELNDDDAAKTTTTTWTTTSDRSTKRNIRLYGRGVDFIKSLPDVIEFEFNGRGGTPDGEAGVGFVAQDLQLVAPETVRPVRFRNEDDTEEDVLKVNPHNILFALFPAVKEIIARLEVLEARQQ